MALHISGGAAHRAMSSLEGLQLVTIRQPDRLWGDCRGHRPMVVEAAETENGDPPLRIPLIEEAPQCLQRPIPRDGRRDPADNQPPPEPPVNKLIGVEYGAIEMAAGEASDGQRDRSRVVTAEAHQEPLEQP